MRLTSWWVVPGLCGLLVLAPRDAARAETKVVLSGVHLCCPACVEGVAAALKGVDGAKAVCNRKERIVTLTALDDATAQKALDALADAGFHGTTAGASATLKDVRGVPSGKVKSLTLTGVHNCCRSCCRAIKDAVGSVAGVTGDTAKPRESTFEVQGNFDAARVIAALKTAGFHAKVKE
jgi:copper chaperone CopZ